VNDQEYEAYEAHKARYWEQVQTTIPFELTAEERFQFRVLLFNPVLMKALCKAFAGKHKGVEMLVADLASTEGVVKAAQMQGEAKGMVKLLEDLFEEAYKENE